MTTQRYNPPNLQNFSTQLVTNPEGVSRDLDQAIQVVTKQTNSLKDMVGGMANGSTTVTGSARGVSTGLSSVTNVVACLESSTAINEWVTVALSPSAGTINLFVWKPTGVADTTPIASTTARVVRWSAWGSE